jgi:hypothetical protein
MSGGCPLGGQRREERKAHGDDIFVAIAESLESAGVVQVHSSVRGRSSSHHTHLSLYRCTRCGGCCGKAGLGMD